MRLRYVDDVYEKIDNNERLLRSPEEYKGKWNELFEDKDAPLYVEFGGGKGHFIIELSKQNPEINFLSFEKNSKVAYKSIKEVNENTHKNYYIVCGDITDLLAIFTERSVDRIYLNFSDPWPKDRHQKRRLTSKRFLDKYKQILKDNGEIHLKTDNDLLFEFSLESLKENGFEIILSTTDLHQSDYVEGNIMTEYEEKFVLRGKNINKLIGRKYV